MCLLLIASWAAAAYTAVNLQVNLQRCRRLSVIVDLGRPSDGLGSGRIRELGNALAPS
jgi:hypothetical protein